MVRFAKRLTGWVDVSWFSVILVVCTVGVAITDGFGVVGVRVCSTTFIITIIVVTGTISVGVNLVSLFLELTTLVSVLARLFGVMTCRFGFLTIWFLGLLRHGVYLHFVWIFQTI